MQLVVLGRDGVINAIPEEGAVTEPAAWQALPGSLRAIARLSHAHYHIVVTTNQPALANGRLDVGSLNRIHEKMLREISDEGGHVDAVLFCPHGEAEQCACRKPAPGMLREISHRLGVDLQGVPVIGDSLADVEAARAVSARPMLVRSGMGRLTEEQGAGLERVQVVDDLAAAADALLASL